jgi:hypothetical protein
MPPISPKPFIPYSTQADTNKSQQFIRASQLNPGCSVYFYIADATGNSVQKIMSTTTSGMLRTEWPEASVTGFFGFGAATQYTFNVRTTCSAIFYQNTRTYYVDGLKLVAA